LSHATAITLAGDSRRSCIGTRGRGILPRANIVLGVFTFFGIWVVDQVVRTILLDGAVEVTLVEHVALAFHRKEFSLRLVLAHGAGGIALHLGHIVLRIVALV